MVPMSLQLVVHRSHSCAGGLLEDGIRQHYCELGLEDGGIHSVVPERLGLVIDAEKVEKSGFWHGSE